MNYGPFLAKIVTEFVVYVFIGINTLSFNFTAKNILNSLYVNNAWSYTFESPGYDPSASDIYVNKSSKADSYNMAGYFPQAGKNFLLGLTLDF